MGTLLKKAKRRQMRNQLKRLVARPEAVVSIGLLLFWLCLIVCAPLFATHDPLSIDLIHRLEPPSLKHLCGSDSLGRDIFSRLLYGGRATCLSVIVTAAIMAPLGLFLGMSAALLGGVYDMGVSRLIDLFFTIPRLILALVFVALLGPSLINAVFAIALTSWPAYARLARAETLGLKRAPFIQAARLQGASFWRILYRYLLPICTSSLLVRLSLDLGGIILSIAAIGFLGLGATSPHPEWGAMAAEGRSLLLNQWWVAIIPGIAIFSVSLACNILGNTIRDLLEEA